MYYSIISSMELRSFWNSGPARVDGIGLEVIEQGEISHMNSSTTGQKVKVLHGTQPMDTTPQTRGMERRPGIDSETAGSSRPGGGVP